MLSPRWRTTVASTRVCGLPSETVALILTRAWLRVRLEPHSGRCRRVRRVRYDLGWLPRLRRRRARSASSRTHVHAPSLTRLSGTGVTNPIRLAHALMEYTKEPDPLGRIPPSSALPVCLLEDAPAQAPAGCWSARALARLPLSGGWKSSSLARWSHRVRGGSGRRGFSDWPMHGSVLPAKIHPQVEGPFMTSKIRSEPSRARRLE
jgi:hypothetical protein